MLQDVREYIDRLHIDGHTIGDDHDDAPILIDHHGRAVAACVLLDTGVAAYAKPV